MAKEEEDARDIDASFEDGNVKVDNVQTEEVQVEAKETEQPETEQPPEQPEAKAEGVVEQEETQTEDEWVKAGLSEFSGKTPAEIAHAIQQQKAEEEHRRKVYGRQTQEIGEMRKRIEQIEAAKQAAIKTEQPQVKELTPVQIEEFNAIWEKNPTEAIKKFGADAIKEIAQAAIAEQLKGELGQHISRNTEAVQHQVAWSSLVAKNPDAVQYLPQMKALDEPEHLGPQRRPVGELYALAKLFEEDKPLYEGVYVLVHRHPTLSVEEAKAFASQQAHGPDEAEKRKLELAKKVAKVDQANNTAVGRKAAEQTVMDIEQAFDGDE